jgi:hypothetical protein
MIPEAEVFVLADQTAIHVYGQIRDDQWDTTLPPLFDMPGANEATPLWQAINHFAYDDSWVPDMLAGRTMDDVGRHRFDGDLLGADPRGNLERIGVDDAISDELARGMWNGTEPSAERWRSMGIFRPSVPVADDAHWRDRFLALSGRRPRQNQSS